MACRFAMRRRNCKALIFVDRADEAEALARQCLDQVLLFTGIADCGPGGIETGRQCGIRDNATVPDGADDVVFADYAVPVADQVLKQVEHLWCERDQIGASTQFAPVRVKCVVFEVIAQSALPPCPGKSSGGAPTADCKD